MRDILEIPPPITEENKDEYLEELSKITEADDWIKRHSTQINLHEVKIIQHKERDFDLAKWWWLLLIPEIVLLIGYILESII
ncbi:MAG TPA: hypothetical protein HA327_05045 [Candidatus Poseidoniaceae archaeon]|nr:MAG TPA: hypothetical protein D7H81_04975 [Candidatus Poseidoniales archaeon]HII45387.1 hypothetical protein [Candidatus Poseidoniaceae archaeon]